LGVLLTLTGEACGFGPSGKGANILFIMTDDQDAMLAGYDPDNGGVGNMPQVNKLLVDQGTMFLTYLATTPLCAPARASVFTGRFPHNHGILSNNDEGAFHPAQEATAANVWLQKAGYETMLVGKYMDGYSSSSSSSDSSRAAASGEVSYIPQGWGSWFALESLDFFGPTFNVNGKSVQYPADAYQTDVITNISLNWLQNRWEPSNPFFMFVAPHAPHAPYTPAPRHKGTLAGLVQLPDAALNESDADQATLPGALAKLPAVNANAYSSIFQSRAESLLAVDEMVAALVGELDSQSVLDKTWIFYSSDNGYHLGQHRLPVGGGEVFEHDINIPLIVRGPGVAKGAYAMDMVQNVDLAPTWLDIAQIKPPAGTPIIDGVSMTPLLRGVVNGTKQTWYRDISLQEGWSTAAKPECDSTDPAKPAYRALRLGDAALNGLYRCLFVKYCDGEVAFFDMTGDVGDQKWQPTGMLEVLDKGHYSELSALLDKVSSCVGNVCTGHHADGGVV